MKQASLTQLRRNLSSFMTAVNTDREPLTVTRRRGKPVVMMSLEDYEALIRQAPRASNADHVLRSMLEVDELTFVPSRSVQEAPARGEARAEPETTE